MSEDNKKMKKTGKIICTAILLLGIAALAGGAVLYRQFIIPRDFDWLFPWMESAVFAGLFLAAFWISFPVASDWEEGKMAFIRKQCSGSHIGRSMHCAGSA